MTRTVKMFMRETKPEDSTVDKLKKIDYPLWNQTCHLLPPRMIIQVGLPGETIAVFPPPQISWLWRIRDEVTNQIQADKGIFDGE